MSTISIDRVKRSFDRSFDSYHDAASQQALIAQQLVARLSEFGAPEHFHRGFEIGCGTGHLTQALNKCFSFSSLTLNDLVPAASRTATAAAAHFLPGDARDIKWPDSPDLIASASTIQWTNAPKKLLNRMAHALAPGGWLAITGFGPRHYCELTDLGSSAQAPGLCEPHVLADAVGHAGAGEFDILDVGAECHRLWFDTPKHALRHLRRTGVNAGTTNTWTRASLARFYDSYVQRFGCTRGVPLTYQPTWIIARKLL